jgi:parvulin-like peptidyl-prolyl isomerase
MEPGQLKVFAGEGGLWHVLLLTGEVPPAEEEFEQIRDRLRAELRAELTARRFHRLLARLHQNATVVPNLDPDARARGVLGEEAAVWVNAQPVARARYAEALLEEFGRAMLEPYVERMLIFQEAERRGLTVSDEELQRRLELVAEELFAEAAEERKASVGELADAMAQAGASVQEAKEDLLRRRVSEADVRATILVEKMVADGVEVTEHEIVEAYNDLHRDRLLVKELWAEDLARARQLRREATRGASFELLARTEMTGPANWLQGALTRTITPDHPYYTHARTLEPGEVSRVFKEGERYRIIKLVKRHTPSEPPPLPSMRQELERRVRLRESRDRIRALLIKLKAEAKIEVMLS